MHRISRYPILLAMLALLLPASTLAAGEADPIDAKAALDRIRALEGQWEVEVTADADGDSDGTTGHHSFRRSANDSVVMETMFVGTDHEMINMYHLDGEDLVLTHYCAGGNQPRMKLDRSASTPKELHFAFDGGTNFDPATDGHIHAGGLTFVDDDHVVSTWIPYYEGKQAGVTELALARAAD